MSHKIKVILEDGSIKYLVDERTDYKKNPLFLTENKEEATSFSEKEATDHVEHYKAKVGVKDAIKELILLNKYLTRTNN